MSRQPLLRLRGITKRYPGAVANNGVDLDIEAGEIRAILGENGAGKSTLMKIIYGVTQPDAGTIAWQGEQQRIASPAQARKAGIGMVFQHFSLFETLSVAQNMALAMPGTVEALSQRVREASESLGFEIDPAALVHSLSLGERQRVEIIRCVLQEPKLLILDEPTSVLPPHGIEQLFETLRRLSDSGCAIAYISHKLWEVRALCSSATVLRRGRVSGQAKLPEASEAELARLMIGAEVPHAVHPPAREGGEALLRLRSLAHRPLDPFGTTLHDLDLEVRAGEIVGIAGVSGNGQDELLRLVSGETIDPSLPAGAIDMLGDSVTAMPPAKRRQRGLAFVPEERLGRGAVPSMSLAFNSLLTGFGHGLAKHQLLKFGAVRRFALQVTADNDVRCSGVEAAAASLSGGNLQKFIIGRELALQPRLLVLAQPTWGVDVGAAAAIRQRLVDLREEGIGILVVSEELDELFEIADRLHVIAGGRLSPVLKTSDASVAQIGQWMSGRFGEHQEGEREEGGYVGAPDEFAA